MFGKKRLQLVEITFTTLQPVNRQWRRRIITKSYQIAGYSCLIGKINQILAPFRLFDFRGTCQQSVEITINVDQLGRCLHTNSRHAGNIVGGIARQRLNIDDLVRHDAEPFLDLWRRDAPLFHWIEHGHAATHKLHQILVGRHDHRLQPDRLGHAGIGGDQIISLEPRRLELRQAQRLGRTSDQRKLRYQLFRWVGTVGLVVGIDIVTKGLAGGIKNDGDMAWRHIINKLHHHAGEAEHRIYRRAVAARHRRQRMESPEDIARPVNQDELVTIAHRASAMSAAPVSHLRTTSVGRKLIRALRIILVPGARIAARAIGADNLAIGTKRQPDPRMAKRIAITIARHTIRCHKDGLHPRRAGAVAVSIGTAICIAGHRHPSSFP